MVSALPSIYYFQREFSLKEYGRGCHLVTDEILSKLPEIKSVDMGLFHLFLKHTSASICLNENFDSDVQYDMEKVLNRIVPEDNSLYRHTSEGQIQQYNNQKGKDDMPAHGKSALIGCSLTIPITKGKLNLGTWQGIWLCEHRSGKFTRNLVATIQGQGVKK